MTEYLVGGYGANRGGESLGIGRASTRADGRLSFDGLAASVPSPSWLLAHDGVLHAALEETHEVASFRIDGDALHPLSRHSTAGAGPCHLAVAGDALIAACYRTGELSVHPLDADGAAGPCQQSIPGEGSGPLPAQGGPHAHHVLALSDGRVLALDLGADRMHVHEWSHGQLIRTSSVAFPPGTGPRDLRELPGGRIAALGEWGCAVFVLESAGDTFRIVTSAVLSGATSGAQAAGLDVSTDGRFLYAALRGPDLVSVVALEGDTARPVGSVSSGGAWPRHLVIYDDVLHVSNQQSNSIASFRLAPDGLPALIGGPAPTPSPTQLLRLDPIGHPRPLELA